MYWKNQGSIIFKGKLYNHLLIDKNIELVCNYIVENKIQKSSVIAIFMDRGVWPLIIMFALLQKGIPFLPIDITLPRKRWEYMLEHLNVEFVVTDDKYKELFDNKEVITVNDFQQIGKGKENIIVENNHDETVRNCNEDIAYYLYTSGSTGSPKAVEVTQRGLKNFITAIPQRIPLHKSQRIACTTMMSFDIFFLESILALQLGMQIVLLSEEERLNPKLMGNLFLEYDVDVVQFTPSHLNIMRLVDGYFSSFQNVRYLLVGGEAFPLNLLKELQQKTSCRIFNMYGPTETTIWSSIADLTNESEVHIGTPILNTQFYILDEQQCPVKEGECGELCISGAGLANGYKYEQALTQEKFIEAPFEQGVRLFRTGDLAKYSNNQFYCLGRIDNQVKYCGHRIELEEIDAFCNKIQGVTRAVTFFEVNEKYQNLITIYEGSVEKEFINKLLVKELPSYMIPKRIIRVEELYLTVTGKVDREKNREVYIKRIINSLNRQIAEIDTSIATRVIQIIQRHIQDEAKNIGIETFVEDLSIDSLDFVTIVVALEEEFQISFEDEMLLFEKYEQVKDFVSSVEHLRACNKDA